MPGPTAPRLGRRSLLIAAGSIGAAATLAACGPSGEGADPSAAASAAIGAAPDALRREVATAERALIAAYDAAIAAFPSLAVDLAAVRAQHADHLSAMAADGAEPPAATTPASPAEAIAALRAAEQQAARARRTSCVAAADPELARVLALIAASEQSHAAYLRELQVA